MSLYSNLLAFHLSRDNKFQSPDVGKFLVDHMLPTKKDKKIFHIDCAYTKKKVCYCKYHESELMPKKEKALCEATIGYLEEEFRGKDKKYYKDINDRKSFFKEKFRNFQEAEDMKFYLNCFDDGAAVTRASTSDPSPNKRLQTDTNTFVNVRPNGTNPMINQESHRDLRRRRTDMEVMEQPTNANANTKESANKKNLNEEGIELVCQFIKCHSDSTNQDDFLCCTKCKKTFHSKCCSPPLSTNIVERYPWYCNECKVCFACKSNVDENRMIICDICDRAFHNDCLNPRLSEIPKGDWYCHECKKCHACKKSLLHEPNFPNLEKNLWDDDYFLCGTCLKHFERKEYCPVCLAIIDEEEHGNYISCDRCNLWIHAECDGMTEKQIKLKKNYVCPICRSKNQ